MSTVPPLPPGYSATPLPTDVVPPGGGPKGCWRTGLIGCGIAALVCLLVIVGSCLYLRRNPQVMTDFVVGRIEAGFASDVTEQDKKEFHAAYNAFRDRMQRGERVDANGLQRIQTIMIRNRSGSISRDQVHELTEVFREAGGLPPATPVPTPAGGTGPPGNTTPSAGVTPSP